MKHYTHKLTALLLAALIMVSPVAQYACAEETVYHTETKYPLLADVRDQLDEDEIVFAYDVVIDMGDYFNPADVSAFKVEKTNQSTDKVDVSFFSAHATDGTAFTSDMPGSYFAYYIAKPVNGHPAYEVSRRITVNAVEEPTAPVVPETVEAFPEDEPADEDSEDDPYEESEIDDSEEAAFDDEGESEEEYDDAEDFPQGGDVSEETDAEEDLSEWEEESDEDGDTDLGGDEYAGEYDDDEHSDEDLTSEDWDEADDDFADEDYDDAGSDEDYYDDPEGDDFDDEGEEDSIDESDDEDESVDDTADENDTPSDDEEGISEDEDSEEAETAPEPSPDPTFDMPQIYDEPIESPEPTDTVGEDILADIPAGIDETPGDGDEAPSEGITAGTEEEPLVEDEAEPSEAFTLPVDQIITTLLEPTLSLASVDGGEGDDDATEEEDDMEEIDPDNIVLEGDAKMVRGSKVTYPSSLGSWSTFKYTVNGKMAYCLESSKTSPKGGSFAQEILDSKYYLKEITPSAGYLLDDNVYEVDCTKYDPTKYLILVEATVKEQIIKQPFQVIKAANNGKTDADLIKGVGFTAWLVSDLMKNADGSYDFSSAEPVALGANGETEIFTDEKGHATSIPLPFGTYIVRETTTPKNYAPVDDFIVTIKENNPTKPQVWRVLLDEEFAAKLKIYKVDSATGRTILLPGAEFSIYDVDNDTFVEQVTTYPQTVKHTTFTTDESGTLTLPETLRPGHYRITEINAPFGYTLNRAEADVTISDEALHQVDAVSGDLVIEVTMHDTPARGRVTVYKEGEMLSRFEDGQFIYEVQRLAGATFEVIAAEDIYTADNQRDADGNRYLEYAAGTVVATLTTDENGETRTEDLPLGTYKVIEKKAPTGFVLNAEPVTVTLEYADQETEIVVEAATVADARQKVSLVVEKKAKDKDIKLPGATLGLYAGEDIRAHDAVIVPAGTCIATAVSDETGSVAFDIDLPLGKYLVNELQAPVGYVLSDEVIELEAVYQGQDVKVVSVTGPYENQPTRVVISKADATTGVELDGAKLTLLDASGKEIDSWTSVAGDSKTPVVTYSEAWQNERQRARVTVVKKDKDGDRLLEGAVFGLYSAEDIIGENGKVILAKDTLIEQRATDSNGKLTFEVDLPVGFDYAVKEITPPAGYASDPNAQTFTFDGSNTDGAVVEMEYTFENMPTLVDVTKSSLTTGEELEGASLQVTDEDGNVIDSWISEKEPHRIIGLVVDKTYTLTETLPASGYATAESIEFAISDTGDVQPVEMKDDVTKVKISNRRKF